MPWEDLKKPDYLAINPNGRSPGFVDGDLKLFESLAITLYLAKKYSAGKLYPEAIEDQARTLQWTLWAATEIEPNAMPALMLALGYSKDEAAAQAAGEKLKAALPVLEAALKNREWLIGRDFTVADLNVAGVVSLARFGKIDLSGAPGVEAWLDRCLARPARNPKS
jgi:glutathione S-transferase